MNIRWKITSKVVVAQQYYLNRILTVQRLTLLFSFFKHLVAVQPAPNKYKTRQFSGISSKQNSWMSSRLVPAMRKTSSDIYWNSACCGIFHLTAKIAFAVDNRMCAALNLHVTLQELVQVEEWGSSNWGRLTVHLWESQNSPVAPTTTHTSTCKYAARKQLTSSSARRERVRRPAAWFWARQCTADSTRRAAPSSLDRWSHCTTRVSCTWRCDPSSLSSVSVVLPAKITQRATTDFIRLATLSCVTWFSNVHTKVDKIYSRCSTKEMSCVVKAGYSPQSGPCFTFVYFWKLPQSRYILLGCTDRNPAPQATRCRPGVDPASRRKPCASCSSAPGGKGRQTRPPPPRPHVCTEPTNQRLFYFFLFFCLFFTFILFYFCIFFCWNSRQVDCCFRPK